MNIRHKKILLFGLCLAFIMITGDSYLTVSGDSPFFPSLPSQESFPSVVANGRHPAPPRGVEWKVSFKEDLTIGVKEGDENYMFGSRLWFNVDDRGNIYAVDWDRKRIQMYGPDGKYRLGIGRRGQGPGEFGNIWMPHFDGRGNLYVRDIVNHKVAFFDPSGKLIKEIKMPAKAGDIQVNSRGDYAGYVSEEKTDPKSGMRVIFSYGLFDKEFSPVAILQQTTWSPASSSGRDPESVARFLAETMSQGALAPEVTFFLGRDGRIYVGYPKSYEIRVYSPEGKPERMIRKDQPPQPVREAHKKDYAAAQERDFLFSLAGRVPESIRKKALSLIRYPKHLPAYQKFALMDDGWLAVVVDAIRGGQAKIDIFDENGVYIAEVMARLPVDGLMFRRDKAYAITETEDGYKFIKRYSWKAEKENRQGPGVIILKNKLG